MAVILWSAEAERFLLQLPGDEAESILAATERMATGGRGFVRNMLDKAGTRALYVGHYTVLFVVDDASVVRVLRVRRRHMRVK